MEQHAQDELPDAVAHTQRDDQHLAGSRGSKPKHATELWMSQDHSGKLPIQKTSLITRKQLACLTGGNIGGNRNPLKVGTPFNFCGGRSMAMSNGRIHHICIKEEKNHPLPKSINENFLMYRISKTPGQLPSDVKVLIKMGRRHPPIPIFWEPTNQKKQSAVIEGNATAVAYVGHWKFSDIKHYAENPVDYLGYLRCAEMSFEFDHFDKCWSRIIHLCHNKSINQIKTLDFENFLGGEREGEGCNPIMNETESEVESNSDCCAICDHGGGKFGLKPIVVPVMLLIL